MNTMAEIVTLSILDDNSLEKGAILLENGSFSIKPTQEDVGNHDIKFVANFESQYGEPIIVLLTVSVTVRDPDAV